MNLSHVELPSNRKFGFFFTTVFAIIGVYFFIHDVTMPSYLLFALVAAFIPQKPQSIEPSAPTM